MSYALKYSRSAETEIEQQVLWYEADEIRGGVIWRRDGSTDCSRTL